MRRMAALGGMGDAPRPAPIQMGMGTLHRQGVDAGVGDVVVLAVEVDDLLSPQLA